MKEISILICTKNRAYIMADFKSDLVREQTIVNFSMHKPEWTQKIIKIMAHSALLEMSLFLYNSKRNA